MSAAGHAAGVSPGCGACVRRAITPGCGVPVGAAEGDGLAAQAESSTIANSASDRRPGADEAEPAPAATPVLKVNGHRSATIADLEHAEAVMGAKAYQQAAAQPHAAEIHLADGLSEQDRQFAHFQSDAPACDNCGALTVRCGTCYRCFNCGNSMGCS